MPTPARSSGTPAFRRRVHAFNNSSAGNGGSTTTCDKHKIVVVVVIVVVASMFFPSYDDLATPSYIHDGSSSGSTTDINTINEEMSSSSLRQQKNNLPTFIRPNKEMYVGKDFERVMHSRDFRDSFPLDRKSGGSKQASPRDTLGSSDDNYRQNRDGGDDERTFVPRVVVFPSSEKRMSSREHLQIPSEAPPHSPKRYAPWTKGQKRRQKYLRDEDYYNDDDHMAENPYSDHPECIPMHDWQTASYPSCNTVHSLELHNSKFIANGFFRDVWAVDNAVVDIDAEDADQKMEQLAVKTLRLRDTSKLDFDARNYHRHRVDAISYERLTSSPYVMNIYGYCGMSGVFEYAPDGDLSDALSDNKLDKNERFKAALEVARSVSDLHNFNGKVPAIAHTDIWHSQFVKTQRGVYALSDFNRAQFLYWNSTSDNSNCPYYYQHTNGYPFRSPEEYKYEAQTEKIDVYSMGNIFFSLLMDKWPYEKLYKEKNTAAVSKLIKRGDRDTLSKELLDSTDAIDVALRTAMEMCWVQDWSERSSSKEVADYLDAQQTEVVKS